jgi:hypothetical protein
MKANYRLLEHFITMKNSIALGYSWSNLKNEYWDQLPDTMAIVERVDNIYYVETVGDQNLYTVG